MHRLPEHAFVLHAGSLLKIFRGWRKTCSTMEGDGNAGNWQRDLHLRAGYVQYLRRKLKSHVLPPKSKTLAHDALLTCIITF